MIAVLGATGRIGRHVAWGLADRSVEAIALVRRPGSSSLPIPQGFADLTDLPSMRAALRGVSRLFLVTPHGPDQDMLEAGAIDAAADAGVAHIVKISGGAPSLGPNGATATATMHWRSEQRIERSGVGFTFLRPSFLTQSLVTMVAPLVCRARLLVAPFAHASIAMIDARDVAECAVAALTDPAPADHAWHLTGPRGVTLDDIAEHLGVPYVPIPRQLARRGLARQGLPAFEVDHAMRMAAYFSAGADGAPTDHVLRLTGRTARSVQTLLDEQRQRFAPASKVARLLSRTPILED